VLPYDESEQGSISRRSLLAGLGACIACAGVGRYLFEQSDKERDLLRGFRTVSNNERHVVDPSAIFDVKTKHPFVGLTFDDGPDPRYTPKVLKLLKLYKAHATFFLIGVNAYAYPELVKQILHDGHSIGNHTFDHPELELLPQGVVKSEIDRGRDELLRAGAPDPRFFRPPKGYTDRVVDIIADKNKYKTVFWTQCVEAFVDHHAIEQSSRELVAGVRRGSIILAHDGGHIVTRPDSWVDRKRTLKALPHVLNGLREKHLTAVDLPRLLAAREN